MPIDEAKIGELMGIVNSQTKAIDTMQKSQEISRIEVLNIFKEMRDNVKDLSETTAQSASKLADAMSQHIKDDNAMHAQILSISGWRIGENGNNGAASQVSQMWDERNKTTGMLSASRLIGGAIWGILILIAGYFMPKHGI